MYPVSFLLCLGYSMLGTIVIPILCREIVNRWDSVERISLTWRGERNFLICCVAAGFLVTGIIPCPYAHFREAIRAARQCLLLGMAAGCLLFACLTDWQNRKVYDFVWWIFGLTGVGLFWCRQQGMMFSTLIFVLLQQCFFFRFYGRADCHAFSCCALAESALGMGMQCHLVHMGMAFVLLALVQGKRRNINKRGNLKKPVPFLPYITVSFFLLLLVSF